MLDFILYSPLEQFEFYAIGSTMEHVDIYNVNIYPGGRFMSVMPESNSEPLDFYLEKIFSFIYPSLALNEHPDHHFTQVYELAYNSYLYRPEIFKMMINAPFFSLELVIPELFVNEYFYNKEAWNIWGQCLTSPEAFHNYRIDFYKKDGAFYHLITKFVPEFLQHNHINFMLIQELDNINSLAEVIPAEVEVPANMFIYPLIDPALPFDPKVAWECPSVIPNLSVGLTPKMRVWYWLNIYNSVLIVIFAFLFIFVECNKMYTNTRYLNIWMFAIDLFFDFMYQTFSSLVDRRLIRYFPLFISLFIVVLLSNLTALIPSSFCLTSNLWFNLTLSLSVWVGVTILGIVVRGKAFFTAFVPQNVPSYMKGFLLLVEILSFVARAISLGVRIFANMLAGHTLVHILADLTESCMTSFESPNLKAFAIFPALILTFIVFIEFGICILQALVFVILTAIYLNEAFGYNTH